MCLSRIASSSDTTAIMFAFAKDRNDFLANILLYTSMHSSINMILFITVEIKIFPVSYISKFLYFAPPPPPL